MDGLIGCRSTDSAVPGASARCLQPHWLLTRLMCSSVAATDALVHMLRVFDFCKCMLGKFMLQSSDYCFLVKHLPAIGRPQTWYRSRSTARGPCRHAVCRLLLALATALWPFSVSKFKCFWSTTHTWRNDCLTVGFSATAGLWRPSAFDRDPGRPTWGAGALGTQTTRSMARWAKICVLAPWAPRPFFGRFAAG